MITSSVALAIAAEKGIEAIVENFVVPKLQKLASSINVEVNDLLVPHREHFMEYLERTYQKVETLNTIVRCNTQLKLKDIYVPLTIYEEANDVKVALTIEGYPKDLMNKYGKILIKDTAGMGKSTMTKRIFMDVVENGYGIPIYVELRRLSSEKHILQEIIEQLDSIGREFDKDLLIRFIENGEFIFILDGYDEISFSEREAVTKDIQEFISKTSTGNRFILSSRPESALTSFGAFKSFNIQPLSRDEAYQLIRNYDVAGKNAKLLIKQLDSGKYKMIDEFLKNPLLVSLLYTAFDYRQIIPLKKHIFYRQVYDAYFETHDLSKGDSYVHQKKTKLAIDDFNRVLRMMGFRCLLHSRVEFTKDELLKLIETSKSYCPNIDFRASDMMHDILNTVPLFVQDGNYYKWSHKSLQEYFAAEYIYLDAKDHQGEILNKMYRSSHVESYYNIFDLYFDIDKEGFKQYVLKDFIADYLKYSKESRSHIDKIEIDESLLEQRLFVLYCTLIALYRAPEGFIRPRDSSDSVQKVRMYEKEHQRKYHWEIFHGITKNGDMDFVVLEEKSIINFAEIIYNHQPELFDTYNNQLSRGKRRRESYLFDEIPADEVCLITPVTAISDADKYEFINQYGLRHCENIYPNIDAFIKELDNIQSYETSRKEIDFLEAL